MSDSYPIKGSPYQEKSADDRAVIMNTTADPVSTVMNELNAILHDEGVQQRLILGYPPTALYQPWINDLYLRGKADGVVSPIVVVPPEEESS